MTSYVFAINIQMKSLLPHMRIFEPNAYIKPTRSQNLIQFKILKNDEKKIGFATYARTLTKRTVRTFRISIRSRPRLHED